MFYMSPLFLYHYGYVCSIKVKREYVRTNVYHKGVEELFLCSSLLRSVYIYIHL